MLLVLSYYRIKDIEFMREFWIIWLNMMFLGDLEAGVSPGSSTNYIRCITFANYSEKN